MVPPTKEQTEFYLHEKLEYEKDKKKKEKSAQNLDQTSETKEDTRDCYADNSCVWSEKEM